MDFPKVKTLTIDLLALKIVHFPFSLVEWRGNIFSNVKAKTIMKQQHIPVHHRTLPQKQMAASSLTNRHSASWWTEFYTRQTTYSRKLA
jgi:hypothetical protein